MRGSRAAARPLLDPDADLRDAAFAAEPEAEAAADAEAISASGEPSRRERPARRMPAAAARSGVAQERRTRRRGREVRHGSLYRGFMGYVGAYLPLLGAFIVLFVAVFIISTVTHTPTPTENWQRIENTWKGPRDKARADFQAAAQKKDVAAEMTALRQMSSTTKSWVDDLLKVDNWTDNKHDDTQNKTTSQDIAYFIQHSQSLYVLIDEITNALPPGAATPSASIGAGASASTSSQPSVSPTPVTAEGLKAEADALAAHSIDLQAAETTWNDDFAACRKDIFLAESPASAVPSLILPSQAPSPTEAPTPTPTPSPSASASAAATASPS